MALQVPQEPQVQMVPLAQVGLVGLHIQVLPEQQVLLEQMAQQEQQVVQEQQVPQVTMEQQVPPE